MYSRYYDVSSYYILWSLCFNVFMQKCFRMKIQTALYYTVAIRLRGARKFHINFMFRLPLGWPFVKIR